jgi:hypothetical protein
VAERYPPLAEDGRIMRAFAKIAITVAFVSAIVWFGHHSHPHNYGNATSTRCSLVTRIDHILGAP